jgi:hypothetical protein
MSWIGSREIAFILAEVTGGPGIPPPPPDWEALARSRIFYDPDATSGVDLSLRAYIRAVSYGMARLTGEVYGPYTVPWDRNGCGWTMDNAIRAAGRPDPDNAANRATLASQGSITGYSYACIVYPGGPCDGWAFWNVGPGAYYPGSTLTGACYVDMEAGLGIWAMENTHVVTGFGDLYGIPDSPGNFDNMACSCGTHPSSFTKMKMGWVNPRVIPVSPSDTTVTLHALSRPLEEGREHAVRIPSQSSLAYLLVEARLRTDPYERSTPGLSSGIPSEGVVVYWIDESSWPPVHLRTPTALGVGQSYTEAPLGIRIAVDSQDSLGFVVTIRVEEHPDCQFLRERIAEIDAEIDVLQEDLRDPDLTPQERWRTLAQIARLRREEASLSARADAIGCRMQS